MPNLLLYKSFPKAIVHIDGDAFFASCEISQNEKWRGKPVVVGKDRGVALAVSYEAKALGVSRGMLCHHIEREFPQVIILNLHYDLYKAYSIRMYAIVRKFTPDVEEYSVDECFADITGLRQSFRKPYEQIAADIKQSLEQDLGMGFSVGLAPTKTLAKVASSWNKPSGFAIIPGKKIQEFLADIPIGKVWGIGPNTSAFFQKQGIKTALHLAQKPEWWIKESVSKPYAEIWHELRGESINNVKPEPDHAYKSIMRTRTFKPTNDTSFILSALAKNVEIACTRLRKYGLEAGEMSVYLKTQSFTYKRLHFKLVSRISDPREPLRIIMKEFKNLFKEGTEYRASGVVFYDIAPESVHQHTLFNQSDETSGQASESLFAVVDQVNKKVGRDSVYLARSKTARAPDVAGKAEKKRQNIPPLAFPYWGEAS